ncbi:MAG: sigma-70 family RNA polymerase sigma factor [Thermomicrobiales bacterium]
MHDVELAQRAQQGDLDAYETLLRRHQQGTHRAAFFLLRQRQEAEDAVQEAFIRAWDRIDQFDVERDFRPWLLKIVVNEARDRLRESGSRQRSGSGRYKRPGTATRNRLPNNQPSLGNRWRRSSPRSTGWTRAIR